MPDLDESWARTVRAAGATADDHAVAAAGAALLARWREQHRYYHDAEHLTEVLAAVDELAPESGSAADVEVVRLAAWFHDAVYDGRPGDDGSGARSSHARCSPIWEWPRRARTASPSW